MLPPRVALLFLTPGPMPLSSLWRQWFDSAAGQIPKAYIDGLYANLPYADARAALLHTQQYITTAMADSQATSIERQFLFSVYMHTHPNYTEPSSGMFTPHVRRGRNLAISISDTNKRSSQVIENLIEAHRMHHSLTEATKLLLQAALQEPLNNRFVLLSETHVPLYPPGLIYLQVQSETLSRMDGCHFWPLRIKVLAC